MSVVNRMLLDIDRRRAAAASGATAVTADVRSVSSTRAATTSTISPRTVWIGAGLVLALVALLWLRQPATQSSSVNSSAVPQTALAPESAAPAAVVAPAATGRVNVEAAAPTGKVSAIREPLQPADRLKLSVQLSALVADVPKEPATKPAREPKSSTTTSAVAAPVTSPTPTQVQSPPQAPGRTTVTTQPVRQVASDETIAAARALWNDGARAGALSTLRDALVTAEATKTQKAIAPLARELARLEVADGRPQAGLELLKRLENEFSEDADAWALRGNAEQRLGLHADAAQSHLIALRIRPNEGKWMIGAAISLAALGKMNEAQTWAERARELNAVTPAIANYLQQLGISTRR